MEVSFEGDWDPVEIQAMLDRVRSHMGDKTGEQRPDFPIEQRQAALLSAFHGAATAAINSPLEKCEINQEDWVNAYRMPPQPLTKSPEENPESLTLQGDLPKIPLFPFQEGEYGFGWRLRLESSEGGAILRLRLKAKNSQVIDLETYYEIEQSSGLERTSSILSAQGIKAIAQRLSNQITDLTIRSILDLEILGWVQGNPLDYSNPEFSLVDAVIDPSDESIILNVRVKERALALAKAAISCGTFLGSKFIPVEPALDRVLVREAIAQCRDDGVDLSSIKIRLTTGYPNFLPPGTKAFCLPKEPVIYLCPFQPEAAISELVGNLSDRLKTAVQHGAVSPDEAIALIAGVARITPKVYLEMVLKHYCGAILLHESILENEKYKILSLTRGGHHWLNWRSIVQCAAEDYRCALSSSPLPNLITLEHDLNRGELARMGQQIILEILSSANTPTEQLGTEQFNQTENP